MARAKRASITALVARARFVAAPSTEQLAERLTSSKRTVERWFAGESQPSDAQLGQLARLVHPRDPALAAEIAAAVGESLASLGVHRPPPPAHLVDAVVCVAAETIDVPSRALRPALLAAFRRARELGLTLEDVEKVLTAAAPAPAPK